MTGVMNHYRQRTARRRVQAHDLHRVVDRPHRVRTQPHDAAKLVD